MTEHDKLIDDFQAALLVWAESGPTGFRPPNPDIAAAKQALVAYIEQRTLTPEEAELLLWELDRDEEHPYFTPHGFGVLLKKLRFLSAPPEI